MRLFGIRTFSLAYVLFLTSQQWSVINNGVSNTGPVTCGRKASASGAEGAEARAGGGDSAQAVDLTPVSALAGRVVPWLAKNIILLPIPREHGRDVFELQTAGGKLIIRASDAPSAAMGLNHYLRYYCHRSVSHVGNNLAAVRVLPSLSQPVRRISRFNYRYLFNYCTLNYSLAFADWDRWQREIDWMALNGVNLALATTGTEAIWENTLRRIGYEDREALEFFPGPAYTAWWLMGNLEGWGGPLSQRMIDDRVALERKILSRMRELGMQPVMQGFYGMVPASLAQKFPSAHIIGQGIWGGFRRPGILLASDPLFSRLASIYYREMNELYGPVHFFGGDLFHEGGESAGLNLAELGRGVQDSMLQANPDSVWVLQGWQGNPKPELLNGLLRPHVLVLNMGSDDWEKRKGFDNSPWIWGIINNFGENTGMFGDLPRIAAEPIRASEGPYGPNMVGIGALMEGIDNNPVVYDLLFETAWAEGAIDPRRWLIEYVRYRYGDPPPGVDRAWQLLLETAYRSGSRAESVFCARPSLSVKGASTWGTTHIAYDPGTFERAAREFLQPYNRLRSNDAYQHDAVDIIRQVLANRGAAAYGEMVTAYEARDKRRFDAAAQAFLNLVRTQDALLGTRREFLLGTWLAAAIAMGHSDVERTLCERNARTQITYWGPDDPATDLHDYASKEWSGLLRDFYLARWELFVREVDGRWDQRNIENVNYFEFERKWTEQRNAYPKEPSGDPVEAAVHALGERFVFLTPATTYGNRPRENHVTFMLHCCGEISRRAR
jgi:alpha-N-acetylglucosaminidase